MLINKEKIKHFISIISICCLLINKNFIFETVLLLLFFFFILYKSKENEVFTLNGTQKFQTFALYLLLYLRAAYQNGSMVRYFAKIFRYPLLIVLLIISFPCIKMIIGFIYKEIKTIKNSQTAKLAIFIILAIEIVRTLLDLYVIDDTLMNQFFSNFRFLSSFLLIDYLIYKVINERNFINVLSLIIVSLMTITTIINIHIYGSYIFYYNYVRYYNVAFNLIIVPNISVYLKNNHKKQSTNIIKGIVLIWTLYILAILLNVYTNFGKNWLDGFCFCWSVFNIRCYCPLSSFRQFAFSLIIFLIIFFNTNKLSKIFWLFPLFINLIALFLINERTAIYSFFILILLTGILCAYQKKNIKYIAIAACALLMFIGLKEITFYSLKYAKGDIYLDFINGKYSEFDSDYNPVYKVENNNIYDVNNAENDSKSDTTITLQSRSGFVSQARINIWINVFKNIYKKPLVLLFGCTETELYSTLQEFGVRHEHAHNEFINLLVARGIFVSLSFVIYCGYVLITGIIKTIKNKDLKIGIYTISAFSVVLLYMMDSGLLTAVDMMQLIFYGLVGFILEDKEFTNN